MQVVSLTQGSPQWHAHRAAHFNASDAPAMLGQSPYKTRAELVKQHATGITPDVDPAAQRRFDAGHRFEALARPLAERIIGESLFPVTGVLDGSKLSASFDGLTMLEDVAFEHKTLNDGLREAFSRMEQSIHEGVMVDDVHPHYCAAQHLPYHYQIQMEQQCMVSGCDKVLFMASQWDAEGNLVEERHCWYTPNPEIRQQIIAGWALFEQDVAAYKADQSDVSQHKPTGRAPQTLPALHIEARGQVLASNLDAFRAEAKAVFDSINRELVTDADFADAEKTVKWCKQVEDKMASAKDAVLGQMADVDAVCRMLDDVAAESKTIRLELDKLVKVEKDTRKQQIVMAAQDKLAAHVRMLNDSLGAQWVQLPVGRFADAIKGLKTLEGMQDKVSGALAVSMAETTATADRLQANHSVTQDGADWSFLFADFATVGLNEPEAFQAIAAQRIAKHKQAEADRLNAERERIEAEAKAKAEREAEAKLALERQRIETEARAKFEEEQAQAKRAAFLAEAGKSAGTRAIEAIQARKAASLGCGACADGCGSEPKGCHLAECSPPLPEDDGSRVKLGQINALIAPLSLTADGLAQLGFVHIDTDKSAKLYRECDLPAMTLALERHLQSVRARIHAAEPATA